jgi:hypothetical protein
VVPEVYDVLDSPEERNLLVLSYADGPDAWLQNWRTHAGELPEEVGFVHVGVATRSSAATRSPTGRSADALAKPSFQESTFGTPPAHADPLLPDAISDPADLARLGICASEYLESWAGDDREIIVFLDSLSEMLEHVSLDRAFKFLQILTARVESVDGRGYYLVDPSAHDDTSLMPLRELVDAAVDLDCPDAGH